MMKWAQFQSVKNEQMCVDIVGNAAEKDQIISSWTCRDTIEYLQPCCWFIENPDSGDLKRRPCIEGLSYVRVEYCMYGCPYRKRTRLWTNCTDWTPKLCDRSH